MELERLLDRPPYAMPQEEKERLYRRELSRLTAHHRVRCPAYGRLLDIAGVSAESCGSVAALPFLPVTVFKELDLKSIPEEAVFKTMTSSGTSGQAPSRIFLDEAASRAQQQALCHIVTDLIGARRMPMLVLDTKDVLRDRKQFSARGAGILGFSLFSSSLFFALDENMELDERALENWLRLADGAPALLYGFTYLIWKHFLQVLMQRGRRLSLPKGILIHGGGWKKLAEQAVSEREFKETVRAWTGISRVHNYYGMVEQTGSIFMECERGNLHASVWSDVLIRAPRDYSLCAPGEEGVIQVVSPLASSYPGHSLLTEDRGILLGTDDCPCGRKGRYFTVTGRVPRSETRGCSDTYEG